MYAKYIFKMAWVITWYRNRGFPTSRACLVTPVHLPRNRIMLLQLQHATSCTVVHCWHQDFSIQFQQLEAEIKFGLIVSCSCSYKVHVNGFTTHMQIICVHPLSKVSVLSNRATFQLPFKKLHKGTKSNLFSRRQVKFFKG